MQKSRKIKVLSLAIILMFLTVPVSASYLNIIIADHLPKEAVPILSQLREIEPYVAEWQQSWPFNQPRDRVEKRIKELFHQSSILLDKNGDNGELFILIGLLGFYGYNLDLEGYRKHPETYFPRAGKLLKNDYRPLWLLGMHLSKSTRVVEGMQNFLEAESKHSIQEPMFWEDYASSAYYSAMRKHVLYALDKVRKITGKKSRFHDSLGGAVKSHIKTPQPEEKIDGKDLWEKNQTEANTTFLSFPFGCKFTMPRILETDCHYSGFENRSAAIQFGLTPRAKKSSGTYTPTVMIVSHVAKENESFKGFHKKFLNKETIWQEYNMGLGLGESSYIGENGSFYGDEGGAKIIMIAFERKDPEFSGFLFEEPRDDFKNILPKKMSIYRLVDRYERFHGKIFYLVFLETPKSFFVESQKEFKDILRTFVVE